MATYQPPKKNTAFIIYTALVSQADTRLLKSGPTLATGDFKVSTDGAAFANLATLPTNTPSGVLLKISLSAGEMNGDNISVACIDAAGAEWCDQLINLQTAARQIDDLAWPATTGRSLLVDAGGGITLTTGQLFVKKNTQITITFPMTDSTNHLPATGLTVTAKRSIDGAAVGNCANGVSELSLGLYSLVLAAGDVNGSMITLIFSATAADTRFIGVVTQP